MQVHTLVTLFLPCTVQLDSGMQYMRNVVGNQFSDEDMVEAMRHCNMDAEAALNQLLERGCLHKFILANC